METLSIGDTQAYPRGADLAMRRTLRHRHIRLPTPTASSSSDRSMDSVTGVGFESRGPQIANLLSSRVPEQSTMKKQSPTATTNADADRHSRREYCVPHSPPYQASDAHRPSLPPLKTVLGDSLTSPPQTPGVQGIPFQPSPKEPSFNAGTYKPPALYPNKKQKIESLLEPTYHYPPQSAFSSPGLPPAPFAPSDGPYHRAGSLYDAEIGYFDRHQRRGSSLHPPSVSHMYSTERRLQAALPSSAAPENRPLPNVESGWRAPEVASTPIAVRYDRVLSQTFTPVGGTHASDRRGSQVSPYYSQDPQRQSFGLSNGSTGNAPGSPHMLHGSPKRITQYATTREQTIAGGQSREYQAYPPAATDSARTPYVSTHAPYYLPSGYDFQQGKARKRSNLPKQSTEIMKTWFDQNIMNPYPSEEQKAMFSGATGISMTQVSNWFINHRRRCPELRDKRDRTRETGTECEA